MAWRSLPGGGLYVWDGGCAASIPEQISTVNITELARTSWNDGEILIERSEDEHFVYIAHWYLVNGSSDTATVFAYEKAKDGWHEPDENGESAADRYMEDLEYS